MIKGDDVKDKIRHKAKLNGKWKGQEVDKQSRVSQFDHKDPNQRLKGLEIFRQTVLHRKQNERKINNGL